MSKVDGTGRVWITTKELQDVMYGKRVPEIEQFRAYFGRSVNTQLIEQVLQNAASGFMRNLVDLSAEVLRFDPHLAGIVTKRVRAVGAIAPRVIPAEGPDTDLAKHYADMVERQIKAIPRMRQKQISLAWSTWNARSLLEIEWAESSNPREQWRIRDLHWIHPRRLSLGPDREIRINDSLYAGQGFDTVGFDIREIPFKFVQSRRQLFNEYPEREGLAIPSMFFSYFKRFSWRERLALMELYGKPLRWIETMQDAMVDDIALDAAKNTADDMGSDSAAALPPGTTLKMQAVVTGANSIHKEISDECNAELSKLVLGSTNTTDSAAGGLGSGQAYVHQDGETLVFTTDCDEQAEDWTLGLSRAIVLLNGGEEAAELYTPKVELPYERPPEPGAELETAKKIFDMGLPLVESEIYERGGFKVPAEGDRIVSPPSPQPAGLPPFSVAPSDTSDQRAELDPSKPPLFRHWRAGRALLSHDQAAVEVRDYQGVPVHVDRPQGFTQRGIDATGKAWSRTYQCDYGFVPNTQGGDGEALDVFLGPNPDETTVYWVKQKRRDGTFDEFKLFVGFAEVTKVLDTYAAHIPSELFAGIEKGTVQQLRALLGLDPEPARGDDLQLARAATVLGLIQMLGNELVPRGR